MRVRRSYRNNAGQHLSDDRYKHMNYARSALKGIATVADRFRSQGVGTTVLWAYARGVPKITGVPIVRYSEVTPHIFIGSQIGRAGRRKLESIGIHNSINLRVEHDDVAQECFEIRHRLGERPGGIAESTRRKLPG